MHFHPFLLATFSWNAFIQDSPLRIVTVAASVFAVLQVLKKFIPLLSGWWAVAANITLAVAGVLATTQPGQLWSANTLDTLTNVIIAVLAAAGIHGTAKLATKGN
jgi:hypothetical protein